MTRRIIYRNVEIPRVQWLAKSENRYERSDVDKPTFADINRIPPFYRLFPTVRDCFAFPDKAYFANCYYVNLSMCIRLSLVLSSGLLELFYPRARDNNQRATYASIGEGENAARSFSHNAGPIKSSGLIPHGS